MKTAIKRAVAAVVVLSAAPAAAETITWTSIVGITVPGNIVGSTTNPPSCAINGQGCINGAGQPWTVAGPQGKLPQVSLDTATGNLTFHVSGLVLAGGSFIGAPPDNTVTTVVGTIFCRARPPAANFIVASVPTGLSREGGAAFVGSVGALPPTCTHTNISFLIQTSATGPWIAFGAQRLTP